MGGTHWVACRCAEHVKAGKKKNNNKELLLKDLNVFRVPFGARVFHSPFRVPFNFYFLNLDFPRQKGNVSTLCLPTQTMFAKGRNRDYTLETLNIISR